MLAKSPGKRLSQACLKTLACRWPDYINGVFVTPLLKFMLRQHNATVRHYRSAWVQMESVLPE
jgi:hypothetical protein